MCGGNKNRNAEPLQLAVILPAERMPLSAGFYGYPLCFQLKRGGGRQQLQVADRSGIYTDAHRRWRRSDNLAGLDKYPKILKKCDKNQLGKMRFLLGKMNKCDRTFFSFLHTSGVQLLSAARRKGTLASKKPGRWLMHSELSHRSVSRKLALASCSYGWLCLCSLAIICFRSLTTFLKLCEFCECSRMKLWL